MGLDMLCLPEQESERAETRFVCPLSVIIHWAYERHPHRA